MTETFTTPDKKEKDLVLWGYILQWVTFVMPFALLASAVYVLAVRGKVMTPWLRTHLNWQLTTCVMVVAALPLAYLLLFTGFAGVNTDAPISIIATFLLVGASALFPVWLIYRFLRGTLRYSKGLPMDGKPWL